MGLSRRAVDDISNSSSNTEADSVHRRINHGNTPSGIVRVNSTTVAAAVNLYSNNNLRNNNPCLLDEHTAAVSRLRAPVRTNLLVSASFDGTIRIWAGIRV